MLTFSKGIARFVVSQFLGYFRRLFLSWSLFCAVFLTIIPAVVLPSFVFEIANNVWPGSYNALFRDTAGAVLLKFWVFFLKNLEGNIWYTVSVFLLVFPLTAALFERITQNRKAVGFFYKKYLFWISVLNIISIGLTLLFTKGSYGGKVYPFLASMIFFLLMSFAGRVLYTLSSFLRVKNVNELGIAIFTEGTILMHENAKGHNREEIVRQVIEGEASVMQYEKYIPIGDAVEKIKKWAGQGAEISYITSRIKFSEVRQIKAVLQRNGFPEGKLYYRIGGETYQDVGERVRPDVLIEDDCESVGGKMEMIWPNMSEEAKAEVKSVVVREFEGIDHLPDNSFHLLYEAR